MESEITGSTILAVFRVAFAVSFTFVITSALFVIAALYRGWALSVLWGWYLVPLGVTGISAAHGAGLAIIAGLLTHQKQHTPEEFESNVEKYAHMLTPLVAPLGAVMLGYLLLGLI